MSEPTPIEDVALHEATRHRYLNYALSVITARALPDVRDGLKPVQRRILYAMYHNLGLRPEARYRKSAAVVGEVMAKYHPHGDSSIYDAMVRMAQSFSLRYPLVDGQGNFGSLDGDPPAAMRYTEARLRPLAIELLSEIKQRTVEFRANYDGQHSEPIVLPAQFPQLLVNGSEGIAVGMATRIPPHNLREVIDAAVLLIDEPDTPTATLCRKVKGPDFPTGGVILNNRAELLDIYESGSGSVRLRGTWTTEKTGRKHQVVVTEVPFGVNKAQLVEKIGELVAGRKVPQLVDVRDESTEDVRVVLELRPSRGDAASEADAAAAMAYLFKYTPLQTTFPVNLTCLVPSDNPEVGVPARLDLHDMLQQWLDFRYETVRRRFEYELEQLRARIHILEGFAIVFDALDEAIRIIRGSEGKRDAAEQLMVRFDLDDVQTEAILELKLYKLAKLEILEILEELEQKRADATRIEAILASDIELWGVVKTELGELRKLYGDKRRTEIGIEDVAQVEYSEDAYIVAEDSFVIVTRDGWIKRQGSFTELEKIRVREGDAIGWIAKATTKSTVTFFTSHGSAYVMRIDDVPSTTGYGEPVQRHFTFADGERVVGVAAHDARALPTVPTGLELAEDDLPPPYGVAVTKKGKCCRFALEAHSDISTRNGRMFMRPDGAGDGVVAVYASDGQEWVSVASEQGNALCFKVAEVNLLRGAGKGVMAMKLKPGDRVYAFELTREKYGGASVKTSQGRDEIVRPSKFDGPRGGRGKVVLKRGRFVDWDVPILRFDLLHAGTDLAGPGTEEEEETSDETTPAAGPAARPTVAPPPAGGAHRPTQTRLPLMGGDEE